MYKGIIKITEIDGNWFYEPVFVYCFRDMFVMKLPYYSVDFVIALSLLHIILLPFHAFFAGLFLTIAGISILIKVLSDLLMMFSIGCLNLLKLMS